MNTELYRPWFAHYEDFVPRTVEIWDKPLYSLLDEAAAAYPHRNALIFQNTRITYKKTELLRAPNRLSKNPGELERAKALSNFQSSPAACTVGAGLFYRREIPFPGEKIATLQVLRPGISKKS